MLLRPPVPAPCQLHTIRELINVMSVIRASSICSACRQQYHTHHTNRCSKAAMPSQGNGQQTWQHHLDTMQRFGSIVKPRVIATLHLLDAQPPHAAFCDPSRITIDWRHNDLPLHHRAKHQEAGQQLEVLRGKVWILRCGVDRGPGIAQQLDFRRPAGCTVVPRAQGRWTAWH